MKKILYLHGLESSNVCDKVDFLKENAIVLAPSIDYRKPNIEKELMDMVESFQPDLIIGSSMGGHVGLMLANYYNIEAVVFNPAIHSRSIEPRLDILEAREPNINFQPVVILGLEDDVINPLITKEIIDDALFYCDIEEVEDLGHRVPFDVFVDIYNKYVI
jgi:pimeloyl-ACP methyl ester carboxylesterase